VAVFQPAHVVRRHAGVKGHSLAVFSGQPVVGSQALVPRIHRGVAGVYLDACAFFSAQVVFHQLQRLVVGFQRPLIIPNADAVAELRREPVCVPGERLISHDYAAAYVQLFIQLRQLVGGGEGGGPSGFHFVLCRVKQVQMRVDDFHLKASLQTVLIIYYSTACQNAIIGGETVLPRRNITPPRQSCLYGFWGRQMPFMCMNFHRSSKLVSGFMPVIAQSCTI